MAATETPVRISDLVSTAPIRAAEISLEERQAFFRAVEEEMERLGFDEANEITAASERLTEHDFSVRINAR